MNFRGGLQALATAIARKIDASVHLNSRVRSVTPHPSSSGFHVVYSQNGTETGAQFDYVFSCLPAKDLAPLVDPAFPALAPLLRQIEYASLTVVNLRFSSATFKQKLSATFAGFGYLVPPRLQLPVLGVAFDSFIFPEFVTHPDDVILTVMLGGNFAHAPNFDVVSPREVALAHVQQTLGNACGEKLEPTLVHVNSCANAIPQYRVGHYEILDGIDEVLISDEKLRGKFFILGNNFRGVGISDCVKQAFEYACNFGGGL